MWKVGTPGKDILKADFLKSQRELKYSSLRRNVNLHTIREFGDRQKEASVSTGTRTSLWSLSLYSFTCWQGAPCRSPHPFWRRLRLHICEMGKACCFSELLARATAHDCLSVKHSFSAGTGQGASRAFSLLINNKIANVQGIRVLWTLPYFPLVNSFQRNNLHHKC